MDPYFPQIGINSEPDHFPMKERTFFPIIKLREPLTYAPWIEVVCSGVVVKAQDLLSNDGQRFNAFYEEIRSAGGIHPFLDYNGRIILSSIMPDQMIAGFSVNAYAKMIDELQPDFFLTPDGETYDKEEERSAKEIDRILSETEYLLDNCLDATPIGLVKGCNKVQIGAHSTNLLEMGTVNFAFHVSDFLRRGRAFMVNQAVDFSLLIREKVPYLLIYGVGAPSIRKFPFADGYITQSHFVNAYYGRFTDEMGTTMSRKVTRKDIMNNLEKIRQKVISIRFQTELSKWGNLN